MKILFYTLLLFLGSFSLNAQIGRVGINTTTPAAMLHVHDSSVVFTGQQIIYGIPIAPPPVAGPGIRMMWYPQKAAFRAGGVSGQQWNRDSIGFYSFAFGENARGKGDYSIAMGGDFVRADGIFSIAMGGGTKALGAQSVAIGSYYSEATGFASIVLGIECQSSGTGALATGNQTKSIGFVSTALGNGSRAVGSNSTATGFKTIAKSQGVFVAGRHNDTTSISSTTWEPTDPLFIIGNGTLSASHNAMTVLKNGNTGIGTHSPQKLLHVSNGSSGAVPTANALAVFESNGHAAITLMAPYANESAIYFGNPVNSIHGGITYNSTVTNGLTFLTNGNTPRAVLTDAGRFGIGTTTPLKSLHVSNGSSGSNVNVNAVAVFEDDGNAAINIITPAANESSVLFGNPSNTAHGAILYNSTAPNGFTFRTNGNNTKAVLTDVGRFGLGVTSPSGRLHVVEEAVGGPYFSESDLIVEDNGPTFLQFSSPSGNEAGIISGSNLLSIRSGINFRADSSVQIRTGGNNTRLSINKSGNTGINTTSPQARLDVNGTVIIGANGTALNEIIKLTIAKDVASIAAGGSLNVDFAVANSSLNSTVYVSPETDLTNGMIIGYARVSSAGNVRVRFSNVSGAAIDLANMNYYITVIR
jgi:hypothetical protein